MVINSWLSVLVAWIRFTVGRFDVVSDGVRFSITPLICFLLPLRVWWFRTLFVLEDRFFPSLFSHIENFLSPGFISRFYVPFRDLNYIPSRSLVTLVHSTCVFNYFPLSSVFKSFCSSVSVTLLYIGL